MKKAFIVTGLGYGDEGKGKVTHWLSSKYGAHTVVRTGGPQAMHRVVSSDGREHVHAQFGSGTLAGAATHLSKNMVIDPHAIIAEGTSLVNDMGISDAFKRMTIHEDALVITPFQAIANRLKELSRGDSRYGSVGVGVGETVLDAEDLGEKSIRAKDLGKPYLREKLRVIKEYKINQLKDLISEAKSWPAKAQSRAYLEIKNLINKDTIEWAFDWYNRLVDLAKIVDTDYVRKEILDLDGVVIFEGSQGVLLDRYYGFHPYTTKVRTIPETAFSIIRDIGYRGEIGSLGVLRAYHTRHGSGPFVAEDQELTRLLPDFSNNQHEWQGNFRVGYFDAVAAKYAIEACGNSLNGLVITCLDRIKSLGSFKICRSYNSSVGQIDRIPVFKTSHFGGVDRKIKYQEDLGRFLSSCSPNIDIIDTTDPFSLGFQWIRDELNFPVQAISTGPTEGECLEVEYSVDLSEILN